LKFKLNIYLKYNLICRADGKGDIVLGELDI